MRSNIKLGDYICNRVSDGIFHMFVTDKITEIVNAIFKTENGLTLQACDYPGWGTVLRDPKSEKLWIKSGQYLPNGVWEDTHEMQWADFMKDDCMRYILADMPKITNYIQSNHFKFTRSEITEISEHLDKLIAILQHYNPNFVNTLK